MKTGASLSVLASVLLLCGCASAHLPKITAVNTFAQAKSLPGARSSYDVGKAELAAGNPSLAIEAFRKDLLTKGPTIRTLNALAVTYSELGRYDVAEQYFQNAFDLDRTAPDTAYNFARLKYAKGQYAEARNFAELAQGLARNCTTALHPDAVCQTVAEAAETMRSMAKDALSRIAEVDAPANAVAHTGLGLWDLTLQAHQPALMPLAAPSAEPAPEEHAALPEQPAQEDAAPALAAPPEAPAIERKPAAQHAERLMLAAVTVPDKATMADTARTRLRIVNGAGKRYMARRMAQYLRSGGQSVNGLANAKAYDQTRSVIRPPGVELVEAGIARSDIELTLGRDLLDFDRSMKSA
jgi:Tfp pilus assembly protein PilF